MKEIDLLCGDMIDLELRLPDDPKFGPSINLTCARVASLFAPISREELVTLRDNLTKYLDDSTEFKHCIKCGYYSACEASPTGQATVKPVHDGGDPV